MKCVKKDGVINAINGRSREGAWIEMIVATIPALLANCRSREGAWIEIRTTSKLQNKIKRRSREGAWIEIRN